MYRPVVGFVVILSAWVTTAKAVMKSDVEYGQAGGQRLLLDVNVPDAAGPFPIAILVHGGGWSHGDKSGSDKPGDSADISPWFAPLTAAKFTWFSINYRFAPKFKWPAANEDLETAIRWVKAHAAEYKGDPNKIVLLGHSAGGHLVTFAGTSRDPQLKVAAVVGFAAVTDLEADSERRKALSSSLVNLTGLPPELTPETRAVLREMSPVTRAHPGMPPVLLLHGDADKTVAWGMSIEYQKRLRQLQVPCDLLTIPGAPHRLLDWAKCDPDYMQKAIVWINDIVSRPPYDIHRISDDARIIPTPRMK